MIKVCVKTNENGCVVDINSSVFLPDVTGWIEIDEGEGDKYAHAQGNYLDKPIMDSNGVFNYKLVEGVAVERTDEEKAADVVPSSPKLSENERLTMLEDAFTELAMLIL